jgi:hypothetical protein
MNTTNVILIKNVWVATGNVNEQVTYKTLQMNDNYQQIHKNTQIQKKNDAHV